MMIMLFHFFLKIMLRFILPFLSVFMLLQHTIIGAHPQFRVQPPRYSVRSGILTLFSEMQGMRSKITVSFDDFGNKEITETIGYRIAEDGLRIKMHTRSIAREGMLITMDMEEMKGKRMHLNNAMDAGSVRFSELSDSVQNLLGLCKLEEKDTVLGYICDVWELNHPELPLRGHYSVWNNLLLKSETLTAGVPMATYAVKIDENVPVDPALFDIPPDIQITDLTKLSPPISAQEKKKKKKSK
jgi:hypothetical protein